MKKLLSLLCVIVLAFCSLSCGNKAQSISDFTFGKEPTLSQSEIETWVSDYNHSLVEWGNEYKLNKSRWYKISFESAKSTVDENGSTYYEHVKGSGWYLASPYKFERKYSLSVTCTLKYVTVDEKDDSKKTQKYTVKAEEVYVEGVTYTKIKGRATQENNKLEQIEYSHSNYVKEIMSERSFLGFDVFSLLNYGFFDKIFENGIDMEHSFVKNKKFSIYNNNEESGTTATKHYIGQVESNTPFIKGLKLFYKRTHEAEYQTSVSKKGEEKPVYDEIIAYKLTVNPSFFGFVSRPRDYHKYF